MPHKKVKTLSVSADSDGGAGVSFLEGRSQTRLPGNVVVHPFHTYSTFLSFFLFWLSNRLLLSMLEDIL